MLSTSYFLGTTMADYLEELFLPTSGSLDGEETGSEDGDPSTSSPSSFSSSFLDDLPYAEEPLESRVVLDNTVSNAEEPLENRVVLNPPVSNAEEPLENRVVLNPPVSNTEEPLESRVVLDNTVSNAEEPLESHVVLDPPDSNAEEPLESRVVLNPPVSSAEEPLESRVVLNPPVSNAEEPLESRVMLNPPVSNAEEPLENRVVLNPPVSNAEEPLESRVVLNPPVSNTEEPLESRVVLDNTVSNAEEPLESRVVLNPPVSNTEEPLESRVVLNPPVSNTEEPLESRVVLDNTVSNAEEPLESRVVLNPPDSNAEEPLESRVVLNPAVSNTEEPLESRVVLDNSVSNAEEPIESRVVLNPAVSNTEEPLENRVVLDNSVSNAEEPIESRVVLDPPVSNTEEPLESRVVLDNSVSNNAQLLSPDITSINSSGQSPLDGSFVTCDTSLSSSAPFMTPDLECVDSFPLHISCCDFIDPSTNQNQINFDFEQDKIVEAESVIPSVPPLGSSSPFSVTDDLISDIAADENAASDIASTSFRSVSVVFGPEDDNLLKQLKGDIVPDIDASNAPLSELVFQLGQKPLSTIQPDNDKSVVLSASIALDDPPKIFQRFRFPPQFNTELIEFKQKIVDSLMAEFLSTSFELPLKVGYACKIHDVFQRRESMFVDGFVRQIILEQDTVTYWTEYICYVKPLHSHPSQQTKLQISRLRSKNSLSHRNDKNKENKSKPKELKNSRRSSSSPSIGERLKALKEKSENGIGTQSIVPFKDLSNTPIQERKMEALNKKMPKSATNTTKETPTVKTTKRRFSSSPSVAERLMALNERSQNLMEVQSATKIKESPKSTKTPARDGIVETIKNQQHAQNFNNQRENLKTTHNNDQNNSFIHNSFTLSATDTKMIATFKTPDGQVLFDTAKPTTDSPAILDASSIDNLSLPSPRTSPNPRDISSSLQIEIPINNIYKRFVMPTLPIMPIEKTIAANYYSINHQDLITDGTLQVTHGHPHCFEESALNFVFLKGRILITDFNILIYGEEVVLPDDADLFILAVSNMPGNLRLHPKYLDCQMVTVTYCPEKPDMVYVKKDLPTCGQTMVFRYGQH